MLEIVENLNLTEKMSYWKKLTCPAKLKDLNTVWFYSLAKTFSLGKKSEVLQISEVPVDILDSA